MTIKQTQPPENKSEVKPKIFMPDGSVKTAGEEQQAPLLQITLPAPPDMNPKAPLSIGQHNACAQQNFKKVADLVLATINNQKLISLAVTEQNKKIKELQKNIKKIADNIKGLIKEDKNDTNTD